MSNKIYTTLLQRQIDTFVATFQDDGASLFKNEQNALIHPGEYGMYRERCFCSLLRAVLTRDCSLSDGFIFSSRHEQPTTQCDILVKNALSMPLTDSGIAKFHPVEDIYAVVEMKSNLTKKELTDALRKLAKVKMIGDDRTNRVNYQEPLLPAFNTIPTFLVCNRLSNIKIKKLNFGAIYDGIDQKYWHNAILSLEDGLLLYRYKGSDLTDNEEKVHKRISGLNSDPCIPWPFPQVSYRSDSEAVVHNCKQDYFPSSKADKYRHIMDFLLFFSHAIQLSEKYQFDSAEYLNS